MRTWKQNISEKKYQRVKRDPRSVQVTKDCSQVSEGLIPKNVGTSYGNMLDGFVYVAERNAHGWEFFKYKVMPVAAYRVDYGYYEERLQREGK